MKFFFVILLFISLLPFNQTQKFGEESPYIILRIMDVKVNEWKSDMLNDIEKLLDAELKYADEKKGVSCASIDFEPEPGSPKQNARFLDISFRGICTDAKGKHHPIEKSILMNAIVRLKKEVNAATSLVFYSIGDVQLYQRNKNKLNLIIIPASIGFIIFLAILTFCLRRMRNAQKHRHIVSELQKKREAALKKAQTIPNVDPHANDKQRLLQLDPSVVGKVSDTMGSPKQFTKEPSPIRNNIKSPSDHQLSSNREPRDVPPPIPSKENRPPYYNRDGDLAFQTQRSLKSSRERIHIPHENDRRYIPTHSQYPYDTRYEENFSMHEQPPRVIVRSIREDDNYPIYHSQTYDDPSKTFVSIPVHVEHSSGGSGLHQRYMPPPYHSDPYYSHVNS